MASLHSSRWKQHVLKEMQDYGKICAVSKNVSDHANPRRASTCLPMPLPSAFGLVRRPYSATQLPN
ncbi:hypothetical protein IEO21_00228 [Rhodonia placenta]|uniref:Uncharacterized protein n=2 Tax=Rhodonia placenta TaxID=104341 RepID=A0A1X6NGP3_9APHY|nr:hypothetical protein POSPLADRAFT_1038192 [Postia placenta MAD-698-R-SB12]KAF9821798.1 hypothetical protein IEO21_00228 [Postia placenta]OSX67818.1 hypothetical protein POSPLADRAFT_1038192 [Postia placenta MAD-698-R-SB12]